METADLLKRVRRIEIKARGLSREIFAGQYHSAFKGRGVAFSEVREYLAGDDVRQIDWKVSARLDNPYLKLFEEEREMTVMLIVDLSGSVFFGTQEESKYQQIVELIAVFSFSVIHNNDKIGVIFFTDEVEKFIPPKKGRKHVLRIISELLQFKPSGKGTDISNALRFFSNSIKKRCTAILISDFMTNKPIESMIRTAKNRHDLMVLRPFDSFEREVPNMGMIHMRDLETGEYLLVDTCSKKVRNYIKQDLNENRAAISRIFRKNAVDYVDIETGKSYVKPLLKLFNMRNG